MRHGLLHRAGCSGKDPTLRPALVPGQRREQPRRCPLLRPRRSLLRGSEGERETAEAVAERHVKILPEPSLQLSPGDVRSASPRGRGRAALRQLRARERTQAPALPLAGRGNKAESGRAPAKSWGTPPRGEGCSRRAPRRRPDREAMPPALTDPRGAEDPGAAAPAPRWKRSRAERAGSRCSGASRTAGEQQPPQAASVPAAPAPPPETCAGTAAVPGARYVHQG